jgi:hypothetical protein
MAAAIATLYSTVDFGELAVRLGSPIRYERLGNVVWYDDFGQGLGAWNIQKLNGDEVCKVSAGSGSWSGYSALMQGGVLDDPQVAMYRYFPVRVLSNVGLEVGWIGGAAGWHAFAWVMCQTHRLGDVCTLAFGWDHETDRLLWSADMAAWHDLADGSIVTTAAQSEHSLKMVLDPIGLKAKRLVIDDQSVDVSGVSVGVGTSTTPGKVCVGLGVKDEDGWGVEYHWGGVSVTVNEP